MVKSENCHLANLTAKQLTEHHEDCNEFGGYFVLNGLEKIIRMLVLNKRNYPLGFIRNTYINRGPNFTAFACQIKSVREDLTSQSLTLHYVSDGNIFARIMLRK
jgi:DNA-directed RNA polymerase I subunit RPA2